jgi:hypothetical protein
VADCQYQRSWWIFEVAGLFFPLVSARDGRGAVIITTNKTTCDGTDRLAPALVDRRSLRAAVADIDGRNERRRDLEDAFRT